MPEYPLNTVFYEAVYAKTGLERDLRPLAHIAFRANINVMREEP